MKPQLIALMLILAAAASVRAEVDVKARDWAAGCNACHGPDGRSEAGMPSLAGRNKEELLKSVLDMKEGRKSAGVMHQIAKGYSDDELRRMIEYFSRLPKDHGE